MTASSEPSEWPVLVLGATGGQGGAVVDALLAAGRPVRAALRSPGSGSARRLEERGVQIVPGSLDDRAALTAAMRGVAGVFALTTPFEAGPDAELAQGRAQLAAAQDARVPHLVFSSVAGADQSTGVPHFDSKAVVERQLAAGDVQYTILGPTYFFDNALGGQDQIAAGEMWMPLPPDRPLQQLARTDLGRFATAVLADPTGFTGQRIELAGDDPTPTAMASALSAALGRPVAAQQVALRAIGSPDMLAMWTFLNVAGYRVDLGALKASRPDLPWTSFSDWASRTFQGES